MNIPKRKQSFVSDPVCARRLLAVSCIAAFAGMIRTVQKGSLLTVPRAACQLTCSSGRVWSSLRLKRSFHSDHEIAFVVVVQNEHAIEIATRIDADYDVTRRTRELARALSDDDLRRIPQIGREYQAPRGLQAAIHDALENIGRGMARRPARHDQHTRPKELKKGLAFFSHRAVLIYDMHVDMSDHGSDGGFEVVPSREPGIGRAGKVAPGKVSEPPIAQPEAQAAHILIWTVGRDQRIEWRKQLPRRASRTGPHFTIGDDVADLELWVFRGIVAKDKLSR